MKVIILLLLAVTSVHAFAADSGSMSMSLDQSHVAPQIREGNWQIGGGFNWSRTSSSNYYTVSPGIEYFLMDHLSLGGRLMIFGSKSDAGYTDVEYGLGPSGTYYFYEQGQLTGFVAEALFFSRHTNTYFGTEDNLNSSTTLGIRFFATSNVAFGVGVTEDLKFETTSGATTETSLNGSFSFYY